MYATQEMVVDSQKLGEEWIQALVQKDFKRLETICQADVESRLMTPKRIDSLQTVSELTQKVEHWFHDCSAIQQKYRRISLVGEKLAILYRLGFTEHGVTCVAEQQIYCTLSNGRINRLSLLCSGFQPVGGYPEAAAPEIIDSEAGIDDLGQALPRADAFLQVTVREQQASTCAVLTPAIKQKLNEITSKEVLEVQIDDPGARDEIEAWCRLSGNSLLKMVSDGDHQLRFYIMKK